MPRSNAIGAATLAAAFCVSLAQAPAQDAAKLPDLSGQWKRQPGVGIQWDQTKPIGLAQTAPLTP